jgi:hypothetical protein
MIALRKAKAVKVYLFLAIALWSCVITALWKWAKMMPFQEAKMRLAFEQIQEGQLWPAFETFRDLYTFFPKNADYLFYAGEIAGWLQNWEESESLLDKCLKLNAVYVDAAVQLGYVYLHTKRWDKAEEIFAKHSHYVTAKEGLAKCALWRGDYPLAEARYRELLQDPKCSEEARVCLARALAAQQKYSEAVAQYTLVTQPDFQGTLLAPERADVASHMRIHASSYIDYMQFKESDPQLKAPVAQDYGLTSSLALFFPIGNLWQLEVRETFYHEKEKNIHPPVGTNFNALLAEEGLTSRYCFSKNWRWDLYAQAISGWRDGSMRYPFKQKTLFEPGTTLLYKTAKQNFFLDAFYDTQLIKNFAKKISQLLLFATLQGNYGYRFPIRYHPELEGNISWSFFHDSLHNTQNRQDLWVRTGIPYLKSFTAIYHFEHASFAHLSPNYYSYKNKWFQGLGVRFSHSLFCHGYFDLFYEHTWDWTFHLLEPIGTFLVVANKQYLTGNKVYSALGYVKNRYRLELSGHYFRNTLPYADWNVRGTFQWQF